MSENTSNSLFFKFEKKVRANVRKVLLGGVLMTCAGLGLAWATYDVDVARAEMEAIENCNEPPVPNSEGPTISPCAYEPGAGEVVSYLLVLGGIVVTLSGGVAMLDKEPSNG